MTLKEELELMSTSIKKAEKKVYEEAEKVIKDTETLYAFLKTWESAIGKENIKNIKIKEKK